MMIKQILSVCLISTIGVSAKQIHSTVPLPIIEPVQVVKIEATDSAQDIIKKATKVRASARQLAYHQEEFTGFIHFGINTFTGREWGTGKESPKTFNPTTVDTDQWCRVMKDAGMRLVMITVKHHDGFCLWQTRYNDAFSVKASPWQSGKGDVLKLLAASAHKYGLNLGVYISPADLYQIENKNGLYGNLSKYQDTIIPTNPKTFKSNPLKPRVTKKGLPTFKVKADDYNRYMMNQLYEVLTEYGPVSEVWFDGAHPKRKGGQKYIKPEWFKLIRQLQPNAVIFGSSGPDIRWCGNEQGRSRNTEWNVIPVDTDIPCEVDRTQEDLGSDKAITAPFYRNPYTQKKHKSLYLNYLVSEINTSIRHGWFWRNDSNQQVRGADEMFNLYERAVGVGGVFLLNLPPNRNGQFSPRDVACMKEIGRRVRETYGVNLAKNAKASVKNLLDHNIKTYWQAKTIKAEFEVKLQKSQVVNRIVLQEAISEVGQRVKTHALDAWIDGNWKEIATATTIGYKRILRFKEVNTQRFRVRILEARDKVAIASFAAHYYTKAVSATIVKRAMSGQVSLFPAVKSDQLEIRYTLDGSNPTMKSTLYRGAFELHTGGLLKARAFSNGRKGALLERQFGLAKQGWKVTGPSHKNFEVEKAVDGDSKTFWHTDWTDKSSIQPHRLTIELPNAQVLTGFTYLPRQDTRTASGMVEKGSIEVSLDGKKWIKVTDFTFGNLVNSPDERRKSFAKPVKARFVRFISLKGAENNPYAGAAEIGLLVK
ncbi:MAG: alpha-L-fucosidase [Lentisphaeria bacterium]|nr:alpha-L-fucosidase [Lentisphaeria bacterium]